MIQIIYRWRVSEENRTAFLDAWRRTTQSIRETTEGARGSFCIVSVDDPTEVLTVARWDNLEQWQVFVTTAKSSSMRDMHMFGEQVSHAAFEQVGDYTV
ncbi:MAG: antibiotic biosynthesis monooxygenase [Pseudomonadota bacterium]